MKNTPALQEILFPAGKHSGRAQKSVCQRCDRRIFLNSGLTSLFSVRGWALWCSGSGSAVTYASLLWSLNPRACKASPAKAWRNIPLPGWWRCPKALLVAGGICVNNGLQRQGIVLSYTEQLKKTLSWVCRGNVREMKPKDLQELFFFRLCM